MNKKSVPVVLVSTVIFLMLGVWAYFEFVKPIYLNNPEQTKSIRLEKTTKFGIGKGENQGKVFGIELEMSGDSESNFDLIINDGTKDVHAAAVKGKDIDFTYKNDWNADSVYFEVIPRGDVGGKITVKYRFLAID